MEIDIAPQFGAELKVRKTRSVFRASTDTVELPGWIQARQRLGTTPYYFFSCGKHGATPLHFHLLWYMFKIANGALCRCLMALRGLMTYNNFTGKEVL